MGDLTEGRIIRFLWRFEAKLGMHQVSVKSNHLEISPSGRLPRRILSLCFANGSLEPDVCADELHQVTPNEADKRIRAVELGIEVMYRTVDGTEFSSLDNSVHIWCDGQSDGLMVMIHAQYPKVPPLPQQEHQTLAGVIHMAELCAGTGRTAKEYFCKYGHNVTIHDRHLNRIEWDDTFSADKVTPINKELRDITPDDLGEVHILHISFDCSTFSPESKSKHQRDALNGFYGTTEEAGQANLDVYYTLLNLFPALLQRFPGMLFTIENPVGDMQHLAIVRNFLEMSRALGGLGADKMTTSHCKFEGDVHKLTHVWTNCPRLVRTLGADFCCDRFYPSTWCPQARQRNGCHEKHVRGMNSVESAAFPPYFVKRVAECITASLPPPQLHPDRSNAAGRKRNSHGANQLHDAGWIASPKPGEGDQYGAKKKKMLWSDPDHPGQAPMSKQTALRRLNGASSPSPSMNEKSYNEEESDDDDDCSMLSSKRRSIRHVSHSDVEMADDDDSFNFTADHLDDLPEDLSDVLRDVAEDRPSTKRMRAAGSTDTLLLGIHPAVDANSSSGNGGGSTPEWPHRARTERILRVRDACSEKVKKLSKLADDPTIQEEPEDLKEVQKALTELECQAEEVNELVDLLDTMLSEDELQVEPTNHNSLLMTHCS